MNAQINSVQTKKKQDHFAIRAGQPDIVFTVIFRNNDEKQKFQSFVREHQINAQLETGDLATAIRLFWPERDIKNWTGYICRLPVREAKFIYAPSMTFGVSLIDSLLSEHTQMFSSGAHWTSIWGMQIAPWSGFGRENDDSGLRPPVPPMSTVTDPPEAINIPNPTSDFR